MTRRTTRLQRSRRGAVAVLACFLMVALLGMLAFAVDLGYIANSQAELRRSADAAALAACHELIYQGVPTAQPNLTTHVAQAHVAAAQYAAWNKVCNAAPGIPSNDITVGYLADPTQPDGTIDTGASQSLFNSVQVTVRRNSLQNGQVPTFFGRVFGVHGADAQATATAALIKNFGGFQIPSTNNGADCLMILPFALDLQTWNGLMACDLNATTDGWNYNAQGQVVPGCDGIREVNLFPQGTGSPGNRGTVNIGASNNSTATIVRQILTGINAQDLSHYPDGQIKFDPYGHLYLNADPGISAGFKSALASIVGQTRLIPIFASLVGNGNNATYDIVRFAGVRIMAVDLTGSMSSKHLTVQPAVVYTRGGIPATSTTTQFTYGTYSPVWLVK